MILNYLDQSSPLPLSKGNESQDNQLLLNPTSQTSSSPCPIFFNQIEEKGAGDRKQKHEANMRVLANGSNEQHFLRPSSFNPTREQGKGDHDRDQRQEEHEANLRFSAPGSSDQQLFLLPSTSRSQEQGDHARDHQEKEKNKANKRFLTGGSSEHIFFPQPSPLPKVDRPRNGSVKWMSSKMRLIKKMMNSDNMVSNKPINTTTTCEDDEGNNSPNIAIKVCSDCNTTKTPLWRSGPRGPKSLCNACGIRRRKARQAMATAVADASLTSSKMEEKQSHGDKKRCKVTGRRSTGKLQFDDFTISLRKNSAFHQVFPQDEKEAAILLMALSCDLIFS